jgi:hypothetical protein
MTATLSTLRIGETITVRARTVNSDGTTPGVVETVMWFADEFQQVFSLAQDSGDQYLAHVTGLSPGSAGFGFEAVDAFGLYDDTEPVTVLNASRLVMSVTFLVLEPAPVAGDIVGYGVGATPWDVRDDPDPPDYDALGSPGITEILWTSQNGAVVFNGQAGGSPAGTPTATGSLKVDIFPDTTSGSSEQTADVITCTAKNSDGVTISGTLPVLIRRVTSVEIQQLP